LQIRIGAFPIIGYLQDRKVLHKLSGLRVIDSGGPIDLQLGQAANQSKLAANK